MGGSVRHGADGLNAADAIHFRGAGNFQRMQQIRIHLPLFVAGCASDNFRHTRNFGQSHAHQGRGGQRCGTAGDIGADTRQRREFFAQNAAFGRSHAPVFAHAGFSKTNDAREYFGGRSLEEQVHRGRGGQSLLPRHGKFGGRQVDAIKFLGVFLHRFVAVFADVGQHAAGNFLGGGVKGGSLQKRFQLGKVFVRGEL